MDESDRQHATKQHEQQPHAPSSSSEPVSAPQPVPEARSAPQSLEERMQAQIAATRAEIAQLTATRDQFVQNANTQVGWYNGKINGLEVQVATIEGLLKNDAPAPGASGDGGSGSDGRTTGPGLPPETAEPALASAA